MLNDLAELDRMASVLETCTRFGMRSIADCDKRIKAVEDRIENGSGSETEKKSLVALREARDFVAANGLLPRTVSPLKTDKPKNPGARGAGRKKPVEVHRPRQRDDQRNDREKGAR